MKKVFLTLVAATVAATMSFAQSNLVATLSHEGEVSVFHGSNSLKEALAAANHGDIITLASGCYNAGNITKAITLRGAGTEADDTSTGAARTEIAGDFTIAINIPDSINEHLKMEGIYHAGKIRIEGTLSNAMLQKCQFNFIDVPSYREIINSLTCIHCKIIQGIILTYGNNATAKFINCVINTPCNFPQSVDYNGSLEFTNCLILGSVAGVYKSYFQNCILNVSNKLSSTNMASYCAGYTSDSAGSPFASLATQATNKVLTQEQMNALFKSETTYELTDEAKAEYVGIDGKELGIYGGNLPYETRILSPQITKCNVAAKTTADGKLSVDIEVKAAE